MASMKRRGIVGLVTALVLGSPFASDRAMAANELAVCVFSYDVQLSPGLSMAGSSSSWSAATVPVNCIGTVNGRQVSGAGAIAGGGQAEGTCAQGSASGTFVATIPTTAGPVELVMPVTFVWVERSGRSTAHDIQARSSSYRPLGTA
jgi:hypothetical protein